MAQFTRVINTSGATTVLATKPCRGYTVRESLLKADGSTPNTPVGFTFIDKTSPSPPKRQFAAPSTTNAPGEFPTAEIGNIDPSFHGPHGQILANGPSYVIGKGATDALPLCVVAAASSETALEVTEYV